MAKKCLVKRAKFNEKKFKLENQKELILADIRNAIRMLELAMRKYIELGGKDADLYEVINKTCEEN